MSLGEDFLADNAYELYNGLSPTEGVFMNVPVRVKERKKTMAQKVLILGDSGTGKSASLRHFKPEEVLVINCAGKPLPFKNHFESVTPKFERLTQDVLKAMDATQKKVIVVDDAQYIMSFQYMRRIKENGWDKWNDIQGDFFNIIKACDYMPEDVVVYFLSHLQRDDEGREKIKTMGKMLDEKITIEGLFTTVLKTAVKDGQYFFLTQNSGMDTVKSPIGMFPSYAIDNDLKYVDTKIRNYYEIGDYEDDATVEKMDEAVKAEEIQKPDADGKRRRNRKSTADTGNGTRVESDSAVNDTGKADVSKVDTGTGTIVGATADEQKAEEAVSKPVTRRRRSRTETSEAITAETTTPAETAENAVNEGAEETAATVQAEPTKRRRRARKPAEETVTDGEGKLDLFDVNTDDLPF